MQNRIGSFELQRELGRGGMGVVYLARDTRLDRNVAIKALPEELASDPVRLERFEREARVLATLSHPNLAGIYGVEEQDGAKYLVLEFVDGETLADRLERGPLPIDEAIDFAVQIAAGIDAAHEAGIIHRDLKPANIIIMPDGQAKVLDFGLARPDEGALSASADPDSPTVATPSPRHSPTIEGAILGTAAYMSPEQARGRRVDKRTDIWSFGVVVYEMLVGSSPFHGESATDSMGAVLHKDIDLQLLPAEVPPSVRHVLERCLVRDSRRRFRDIGDVRLELLHAEPRAPTVPARNRSSRRLVPMLLLLGVGLAAAAWFLKPAPPTTPAPSIRLVIPLPDGMEVAGPIAIAPNGETIAFTATDAFGVERLYTRRLDAFEIDEVEDSVGARAPFFSPDSTFVGFAARGGLRRVPIDGGRPVRITAISEYFGGGSWGDDDTIIYSEVLGSPLKRVGVDGRLYDDVTKLVPGDGFYAHVWPQIIPGTSKVLFTGWTDVSTRGEGGGRMLDRSTGEHRSVAFHNTGFGNPSRWIASGHLLFEAIGAGEVRAVGMRPEDDAPVAQASAKTILTDVDASGSMTRSFFDVSENGTLAYVPRVADGRRLVWIDAQGSVQPVLDQSDLDYMQLERNVVIAPDGKRALLGGGGEIGVLDFETGLCRRITNSDGNKYAEAWARDGSRVFFTSNKDKRWSIWAVGLGTSAVEEMVIQTAGDLFGVTVASDGTIVTATRDSGQYDLLVIEPDGTQRFLTQTPDTETDPQISPDDQWVAFEKEVIGILEVFVADLAGTRPPMQVSRGGGASPKWSDDGAFLYFRRGRSVARIGFANGRAAREPETVFAAPRLALNRAYDIDADGTRMLAIQVEDGAIPDEIRVVTNVFDEIRRVAGPGSRQDASP